MAITIIPKDLGSGGTITGPILLPDGTAAAPSLAFSSDADGSGTGLFRESANTMAFASNGINQWRISPTLFGPVTDNADDIGSTTQRVKHIYTGRIVTGAATPTVTATGYGATGSVAVETGSSDAAGIITLTVAGAGPAASGTAVLTFSSTNGAYGTNTPVVIATLMSGTGSWDARATAIVTAASTTGATITWDNNAVALVAGSTWKIAYHVIGK